MTSINNYATKIPVHKTTGRNAAVSPVSAANVLLSVNPFLLGNPNLHDSCTYGMWFNDRSIQAPDWRDTLRTFFADMNMPNFNVNIFDSFWQRWQQDMGGNRLWQIRMTPEATEKTVYLCRAVGKGLTDDISGCRPALLKDLREEQNSIADLNHLQARVSLIPKWTEGKEYSISEYIKAALPATVSETLTRLREATVYELSKHGYVAIDLTGGIGQRSGGYN